MINATTTQRNASAVALAGLAMALIGAFTSLKLVGIIGLVIVVLTIIAAANSQTNRHWIDA